MDLNQIWQSTLAELELQISRPNFLTWLKKSRLVKKEEDGRIVVGLVNNFAKEWVENKYHKMILETLHSLDETIKKVEYTVLVEQQSPQIKLESKTILNRQTTLPELKVDPETNLHPRYTLNSFVVGSSNELAYAATQSVIKDVGKKYNPLFIYGGTGLGKTHLIQAAGNEIKNLYKNKIKVKYVSSEKFVNDVVWAIRNKRMDDVKSKYRNVDVLIIDDIQFVGGKERSEEEFFHTFNVLYENNKQIIISSDRPPAAIPTLEERLRSRFEGGMIADITYPDYEMRMAIIKTKLQEKNADLPEEICGLVANKIQRNIREIEGILNKIIFYREVKNIELTTKVIEEIIDNIIQQSSKNITASQIIKAVADFYEITLPELTNRSRKKSVVEPRQVVAFLLRDLLDMSYPDIGEKLGKRDHTTAIYSCGKGKEGNCRLKRRYFMLAKKFRLPIQSWMNPIRNKISNGVKDKNKKAITKKGNFFIVKVLPNNLGFSRFGAIIGLRTAKKASRRNYLKRTIFDFIRLNNFHLRPGKDFLIIVLPAAGQSAKTDIEKELNLLLS